MQPEPAGLPTREAGHENQAEDDEAAQRSFCALRPTPRRIFAPGVTAARIEAINLFSNK